ncbi:MAG TPA: hypothetical protein VJT85_01625, partial [Gemmatimonadaceae bacterium]|nr:hypothetical protein [Gemmatimonadaceae bacterium]
LKTKLAGLTMRPSPGKATSPLASAISGKWYELADNGRGLRAVSLDLTSQSPALLVRTTAGETRTPLGIGTWVRNTSGFANGIERMLSVPEQPQVAASGSWTADSVFRVKLVAPETPFYSTLDFRFAGEVVVVEGEHNVSFGQTKLQRLEGKVKQ